LGPLVAEDLVQDVRVGAGDDFEAGVDADHGALERAEGADHEREVRRDSKPKPKQHLQRCRTSWVGVE
jgi:hypothetical protein